MVIFNCACASINTNTYAQANIMTDTSGTHKRIAQRVKQAEAQQRFKAAQKAKGLKKKEVWVPDSPIAIAALNAAVDTICNIHKNKTCITGNDLQ